jgi:homocitrate synthase
MRIELIDTTLRDGQQSPLMFDSNKYRFNIEDKKNIVHALIDIGVRYFEFFSPNVSELERDDFLELKEYIHTITMEPVTLLAHCRCNEEDIQQALELGFNGLNLYYGTSELSQKYNHGTSLVDIAKISAKILESLRQTYPDLYIRYSCEDSFRTEIKDILTIYDQLNQFVNVLGMPDTVGVATPDEVAKRVNILKNSYPNCDLECHFHNDRGLAVYNSIVAAKNGVKYIDCSIWGLAERSGISSTTALLLNLFEENREYVDGYKLTDCYPINVLMGSILKLQVPYTEPVSLTNRTHTAGVHQKAVLNNSEVYEAHNLSAFGVNRNSILLGPLSGWNLIAYYLREIENFEISNEVAKQIAKEFKNTREFNTKLNSPEKLLLKIVEKYNLVKRILPQNLSTSRLEKLD